MSKKQSITVYMDRIKLYLSRTGVATTYEIMTEVPGTNHRVIEALFHCVMRERTVSGKWDNDKQEFIWSYSK